MAVPRQGVSVESGRANQKRRTRAAIVQAARRLLEDGETPTVAQAAEAAGVGRTTAYRYFPTQESLLLEVAVGVDVDEVEELVAAPPPDGSAVEHLSAVLRLFNQHLFADELRYRTMARLYLDLWLAARAAGDDEPVVREGRRRRWIETLLAPLRPSLDPQAWDRLVAALALLIGAETMIVLRDVCHLDVEEAVAVTDWAARTLVAAATSGRS